MDVGRTHDRGCMMVKALVAFSNQYNYMVIIFKKNYKNAEKYCSVWNFLNQFDVSALFSKKNKQHQINTLYKCVYLYTLIPTEYEGPSWL